MDTSELGAKSSGLREFICQTLRLGWLALVAGLMGGCTTGQYAGYDESFDSYSANYVAFPDYDWQHWHGGGDCDDHRDKHHDRKPDGNRDGRHDGRGDARGDWDRNHDGKPDRPWSSDNGRSAGDHGAKRDDRPADGRSNDRGRDRVKDIVSTSAPPKPLPVKLPAGSALPVAAKTGPVQDPPSAAAKSGRSSGGGTSARSSGDTGGKTSKSEPSKANETKPDSKSDTGRGKK